MGSAEREVSNWNGWSRHSGYRSLTVSPYHIDVSREIGFAIDTFGRGREAFGLRQAVNLRLNPAIGPDNLARSLTRDERTIQPQYFHRDNSGSGNFVQSGGIAGRAVSPVGKASSDSGLGDRVGTAAKHGHRHGSIARRLPVAGHAGWAGAF